MIISSAIQFDGKVFTGKRHCDCFRSMEAQGMKMIANRNEIQGFITDDGTFLDRSDALTHAIEAGQIEKGKWGFELYSEDLW